MLYQIIYQGQPIGASELEGSDSSMGVAFGEFTPLPAYESVRGIFQLFTEAQNDTSRPNEAKLAQYYRERDALELTLEDANGHAIPTSWIHIVDWGDDGREVSVQITNRGFWHGQR